MKKQVIAALMFLAVVKNASAQESPAPLESPSPAPVSQTAESSDVNLDAISVKDQSEDQTATEIISREKMDEENVLEMKDAFRHSPDVNVGGGQEVGQKIYVRGIEDTQLNVTVDGARQSGYMFHHRGRVTVDLELIKQVDVVSGTGSALAGAGALGGAIRFDTKDAEDLLRPGSTYGAFVKGRYQTVSDEKGASLGLFAKPTERTGILLYGTLAESIDYRTGNGARQDYTAAKPKSYLAKATYKPGENQKLTLSTVARVDNATRLLRAHFGSFPANGPRDEKFKNETYTLRYDLTPSNLLNIRAEAYDTKTEFSQANAGVVNLGTSQTTGVDLRNLFKFGRLNVTAGADYAREKGEAVRTTASASETVNIFGVYAQGDYSLTERWGLSAGLRFDDYNLKDISSQSVSDTGVSPNVGVRYALTKEQGLFANYSQAFKGPTPIEAYTLAGATGAASNPNVKGTRAETSEIGWEQKKEVLTTRVSAFYTKFNHPLDNVLVGGIATRQNVPDIKSQGFTLSANSVLNKFELGGSYTHMRLSFGDQPIGYSGGTAFNRGAPTGDRVNARLGYRFTELNLVASFQSLLVMDLDRLPVGQSEQEGYDIHDINLSWLPNDRVQVNFTVQNIFDRYYVAQGTPLVGTNGVSSVFEPGRDFRLSASYLF